MCSNVAALSLVVSRLPALGSAGRSCCQSVHADRLWAGVAVESEITQYDSVGKAGGQPRLGVPRMLMDDCKNATRRQR